MLLLWVLAALYEQICDIHRLWVQITPLLQKTGRNNNGCGSVLELSSA